jgi:hypothetical protein
VNLLETQQAARLDRSRGKVDTDNVVATHVEPPHEAARTATNVEHATPHEGHRVTLGLPP